MFTGIVEAMGTVVSVSDDRTNRIFTLSCPFTSQLKVDQSLAHDGVCLTVTGISDDKYTVTAIKETLALTTLGTWQAGTRVNLERCMPATGRFDGHIVQGHVDTTAVLSRLEAAQGSWYLHFEHGRNPSQYITVPKGSVCVNGVSLTVVDSSETGFSVAIIPYTWEHTSLQFLKEKDAVNIEFDILGKYMAKLVALR